MHDLSKPDSATSEAIARVIQDDTSPVGIDAKKTHILIIHLLQQLHRRLDRLEQRLESLDES